MNQPNPIEFMFNETIRARFALHHATDENRMACHIHERYATRCYEAELSKEHGGAIKCDVGGRRD